MGDPPVIELFLLVFPLVLVGAALAVVLALLGPVLGFLITLPFRILGLVFGLLGALLALPFLILGGVLGLLGLGFGLLVGGAFLLLPLLPLALVVFGLVWLLRRSNQRTQEV